MTLNRRMTVTCAVAVVLVSTVMYTLFDFADWFYAGIGAAAVAAACGALTRVRVLPVPVCLAVSVLGQLYYLDVLFEARHCLLRFLPTPASIRFLWDLASIGIYDAHKYAPPAQQVSGLLLLAAAGIGITAVLTDLIAVRLRSTALAGLPLLVLFTVPVTMNAPSGEGTIIVFSLGTIGYLAMLSADGRERIRVWGRLVSLWRTGPLHEGPLGPGRRGPGRSGDSAGRSQDAGPDTRALAAAGRRVGLASVVLALAIPLIVPGLHPGRPFATGPGIGGNAPGQGGAALPDALAQTLSQLRETHPTQVLAYTTSASAALQRDDAQYLHQWVLDTLGDPGTGWEVTSYYTGATQSNTLPSPPGLTVFSAATLVTTTVTAVTRGALTSSSAPTFLPVPYPANRVNVAGTWLTDPDFMVFSAANDADVESYQVTSYAVDPTPAELEAAAPPPLSSLTGALQLPSAYRTPALEHIADLMTAGDHTEYEKVRALADWLSGNEFTYDDGAKSFDTPDGLLNFLDKTRKGVCVQSAYAMTVLTRLLGIPARMVQGYTAGTPAAKNYYVVRSSDAHVWTEVYFTGYGWIRFEPTPSGQGTAQPPNYMGSPSGTGHLGNPTTLPSTGPAGSQPAPRTGPFGVRHPNPAGDSTFTGVSGSKSAGSGWAAILLAVLAAIALACGVIAIVAPPAHRALSAHADAPRRRPVNLATVALAAAAAAVVLLALYRVLSHAGIDLRAGWATVGIAFGAACAVMLVAPATCRFVLRRWRWALAKDDAGRAHAAWRELRDDLADLGVSARPSEPPRTLAGRVTAGLPEQAGDAVRRLALAEERASYAARPVEGASLRRDGAVARRGIAATARPGARWRARIFPASVLTAVADGAAAISERVSVLISRRMTERRHAS
jgi:transglutaminase-like putative cysteine protease